METITIRPECFKPIRHKTWYGPSCAQCGMPVGDEVEWTGKNINRNEYFCSETCRNRYNAENKRG